MDLKNGHMDYNLECALTFKCIFNFHFNIFYRGSIYDTWWGKKWIEKNYNQNFNQQIIMDFFVTNVNAMEFIHLNVHPCT
jgi:hypothetical protein